MIALMFYLKYHNRDSQAVLGSGGIASGSSTETGTTNSIGNADTVKTTSRYVNFSGIEGVFGGIYEWVSGVDINNYVWTIKNPSGTTRNVTACPSDGWIKEIAASTGPYFDVIPTEVLGSSSKHYSDTYSRNIGICVLSSSGDYTNAYCGVACTLANLHDSYVAASIGSRLAFRGKITAVTADEYKNPTIPDYITINQNISNSDKMITGDINGRVIKWIRKNSHRYLGKYTGPNKMTVCQLNDSNGTQYFDGSISDLMGNGGDVFMKLPRFFYKATETSSDMWQIGFSRIFVDNTWKEWKGNDLIGVYEASVYGVGLLCSISNKISSAGITQDNFKAYAVNKGVGYRLVQWKHHNIMAFLFYAEYGTTDCQKKIGSGTSSYTKLTGITNALGMIDTVAGGNGDSNSINFFGLENWWGNKYEWVGNVVVNPVSANGIWRITEDDGGVRDVQGFLINGYPLKMVIGENLDLITKEAGGSDSTGYCDYSSVYASVTRVVLRSCYYSNSNGGVACALVYYDSSRTASDCGSRLAFLGEITEEKDVTAFKALPIIN